MKRWLRHQFTMPGSKTYRQDALDNNFRRGLLFVAVFIAFLL